ncbi:UNVERIFIED_CONTAM: hypothetical protein Slati_4043900 [Sesamum latifolium]|uniref:Endonuclease/exonuclease/phosphatase domain-containing protein n=1 Tax=Sesamum latifolium TaxID=2727402 RepID=A0AAW2TR11_9LAMI
MVLGDFNTTLNLSEICGVSADHEQAMGEFSQCLLEAGLTTLPMRGAWFSCHLRTSDHSPLIVEFGDVCQRGKSVFRFDNFIAKQPGFLTTVQNIWRHDIHGSAMYSLVKKLKLLKPIFRKQRLDKGDLHLNVKHTADFLKQAQTLLDKYKHDPFFLKLEQTCRTIYNKTVFQEQDMLRQRAKMSWLKDGAMCSRIFFQKVKTKRALNKVFQIHSAQGHVLTEQDAIRTEFLNYYKELLGGTWTSEMVALDHLVPWVRHRITHEEASAMVALITDSEINNTLFDISEEKFPDPDGYTSAFFKAA